MRALLRFEDGRERETELTAPTVRASRLAEVVRHERSEKRVVYVLLRRVGEAPDGGAIFEEGAEGE